MGRELAIRLGDREFVGLRYDNFRALGAKVHPAQPWVAVPFHRDIADVVNETRAVATRFEESLLAQGLGGTGAGRPGTQQHISYQDKLSFPFLFFRGEKDKRYGIMPTRYRFSGEPDPLLTTRSRIHFEQACAKTIAPYLARRLSTQVTDEHCRAAARHYGAPSSFVDFSFDPEVAAFFAHPQSTEQEHRRPRIGTIYGLNIDHFQHLFGMNAWAVQPDGGRDIHAINVYAVWNVPYLSFDPARGAVEEAVLNIPVPEALVARPVSIRTRFVPGIPRIVAQEGIFVEAAFEHSEDWWAQVFLWTVLDFIADKWCFLRGDFHYQNPKRGIVAGNLFPPDDPELRQLTEAFRNWT